MNDKTPQDREPDMNDLQEIDALIGAYALDALSDEERGAFELRLADSESLRNEATELADTAVLLGLSVAPEQPRASLKASIFAQLDSIPQDAPEPLVSEEFTSSPLVLVPSGPTPVVSAPTETVTRSAGRHAEDRAKARWFTRPVTALVAVAAAVVVLGASFFGLNALQPDASQDAAFARIVAASDHQSSEDPIDGGGTATLHWSQKLGESAIVVDDISSLSADEVYELWYIDDSGTATPAGLFTPKDGDHTAVLDGKMAVGDTVGVTVEPKGGSDSPTSSPVVTITTA